MTSNSVWVVEQGEYSDYHVVGVYSSKENAEYVVSALNGDKEDKYYEATVAEWSLDPAVNEMRQGLHPYIVWMQKDGTTERVERWDISGYDLGGNVKIWRRTKAPAYRGKGIPDIINATVWASDDVHAVKIVNEHRTRMIASGEWDGGK